jgi:hypothetical protein
MIKRKITGVKRRALDTIREHKLYRYNHYVNVSIHPIMKSVTELIYWEVWRELHSM